MTKSPILSRYKVYLTSVRFLKEETINNQLYEISIFLNYLGVKDQDFDFEAVDPIKYFEFRYLDKNYTIAYTNKIIQNLLSFYKYMEDEKIIANIPWWLFETGRPEEKIPVFLNMYEVHLIENQFSNSQKDVRDAAIVSALLSTGLRISELLDLKLNDYLNDQLRAQSKCGRERMVIINPRTRLKIATYLKIRKKQLGYFLFCNNSGGRLSRNYIDMMVKRVCKAAGITKKVSAHTFRHTYAQLLLEGGANLIEARDLLGHVSVTSTMHYSKASVEHLRKEMALAHPSW